MEMLLALILPLALVVGAYALLTGRSVSPSSVMRVFFSLLRRIVGWIWKRKPQRGGAGRIQQPRARYYR
ncbi:MAG: hypothetical protein FJZ93_09200 [Chloroflexi bacterium]|nr:hypothetical protein [Chloroflexota bacterium]